MNTYSGVLQESTRSNMLPDESGQEPKIDILEHPKSRGFRFRYTCEGPSHGGIPGASSDKNKKTFPAVRIINYQGYARIVVQLVTNEENPRLHPHSLVGKQCQNGICTVQCGPKDMTATFPNLGIQHVTKKNVATILEDRYIAAEMQLSSINDGFPQEVQRNIKDEDRKRIALKAQSEAKSIDLSVVRLMFIAYLPDSNGAYTMMLKPVISEAIYDSKAPNAATLRICRMDCNAGSAAGGDEVYLLCDKVQKDDIQVRFFEEDMQGNEIWEGLGNFSPTDVHRQFAIVFRTPSYRDSSIKQPVSVSVQLRRKSDSEVSESRPFTYLPNRTDLDLIDRKRRKVVPDFFDVAGGNDTEGFNFGGAPANMIPGVYRFQGSPNSAGNRGKIKEARPPPVKQENPQKGPLDPTMLLKISSIKQEPGSPTSSFRHSSYDSSSSQNAQSPMSEGSSPSTSEASPPSEPEYFPGTQIPMPRNAKSHSGLPKINFSNNIGPSPNAYSNNVYHSPPQQTLSPQQQQSYFSPPQCLVSDYMSSPSSYGSPQYTMDDNVQLASPTGDASRQSMNNQFAPMMTVNAEQYFTPATYDQNQNPMQNPNDIIQEAFHDQSGPGSGSINLSNLVDPLMMTPLNPLPELANPAFHFSLSEIFTDDMFTDIESDAGIFKGLHRLSETKQSNDFSSGFSCDERSLADFADAAPPKTTTPSRTMRTVQADEDIESDAAAAVEHSMRILNLGEPSITSKGLVQSSIVEMDSKVEVQIRKEKKIPVQQVEEKAKNEKKTKQTDRFKELRLKETSKVASAMHDYSVSGDVRMLLALQRHLTSVTDDNGHTVCHLAVIHDQLEALKALLDVIKTLNKCNEIVNRVNKQQQTALHIASLTDNVEAVTELLKAGADPLIPDRNGNHALHVASRHGNADILSRLLNCRQVRGRKRDTKNYRGQGCFHLAVKAKKHIRQCMKILRDHKFDVNLADDGSRRTALHIAVENNNLVATGCLISECNADIDACTCDGYTPLHVASANGCCDIAMLLTACGADVEASTLPPDQDNEGEKPIDLAQTEEMRDILSGKNLCADNEQISFNDDNFADVDDLSLLDPLLRHRLCNLLNAEKNGSDWLALAHQLQLSSKTLPIKCTDNPTDSLIQTYTLCHGTVDGLRSALIGIGRHDAVQLLNRALLSEAELPEKSTVSSQLLHYEDSDRMPLPLDNA